MQKKILLPIICLICLYGFSQEKITIHKPNYLEGAIKKADLQQRPFDYWYNKNYNDYTLDSTVTARIKTNCKDITIKAFMGTWCVDSKLEVPRFYKLMEAIDFDENNIEMLALNRSKKSKNHLEEGYNIIRVPTFIFYKNGKEIGRFVEYPIESLEKDILRIVSDRPYKHAYSGH